MRLFLGRKLSAWGKIAELLFFPSFCELCHSLLEEPGEEVICHRCRQKIRPCSGACCPVCGRFFEGAGAPHLCSNCLEKSSPLSRHRSFGRYEGTLKDVILLFKYHGYEVLGRFLGDLLARTFEGEEELWEGVEAIVPVPMHPEKKRRRGFNQAEVLALRLARHKELSLYKKGLIKIRDIPPQTTLEAGGREKNVEGAFQAGKGMPLEGKILLLVDDVYTTGSTLRECGRVLKGAGAEEVRALTVAQA